MNSGCTAERVRASTAPPGLATRRRRRTSVHVLRRTSRTEVASRLKIIEKRKQPWCYGEG
eukprot:scaffold97948_cov24-Phaeocystis_antarctica.AAC.2